jgi:hypothetical protein
MFCVAYANAEVEPPKTQDEPSLEISAETTLSDDQLVDALSASEVELDVAQKAHVGLVKQLGSGHPRVMQSERIVQQLSKTHALRQKILPLLVGPRDVEKQKKIVELLNEYYSQVRELYQMRLGEAPADKLLTARLPEEQELTALKRKLELAEQQLVQRQKQLGEMHNQLMEQMAQQGRARALPELENAELKIFALKSLPAPHAANAIEDLFGADSLRVSIDDRSNSLIVLGKPESIQIIEALLMNLDQKQAKESGKKQPQPSKTQASRPLQLRLFWLADGVSINDSKDPAKVLPASVLRATEKLGLVKPRLVTQSVLSMAVSANNATEFSAYVPAILSNRFSGLSYGGKITLNDADQVSLAMHVDSRQGANCQLEGSLTMPLGHYMVLGTADTSLQSAPKKAAPENAEARPIDASGGPEGEFGVPSVEGAPPPQAEQPQAKAMRFAFVVQVDEAESFAPDDSK